MKRSHFVLAFAFGLLVVLGFAALPIALPFASSVSAQIPAPKIRPFTPVLSVKGKTTEGKVTEGKTRNLQALLSTPQPESAKPTQPTIKSLVATEPDGAEPEPLKPFEQAVKGMERLEGLFTLYRDREAGKLYAEIQPNQLNRNFLCTMTLESGIGERGIYSGLPLADFLFNFRQVNKKLQFIVPNVYFRTQPGDPLKRSVQRSFSPSVLQALPIRSVHPKRQSLLIDLEPLFLSDLPGLTPILSLLLGSAYNLDASKSYFGATKTFPLNVELESVYGFSTSGQGTELPGFVTTLPDSRTFNLHVRFSLSQLSEHKGFRPRKADDRVGYFITAHQNFSDDSPREPFVRYVNRWHLEKQDPSAALSPPKQPIVFWIENTVPLEYRAAVRDGILMWNKAFEAAGFKDAIVAKQMPDNATWDPADVRYNTIRWLTSFDGGFLGAGPSRMNPLTGEILDADILIDASFARYLKQQYRSLAQRQQMQLMPSLAKLTGNPNICRYGMDAYYLRQSIAPKRVANPRPAWQHLGNTDLCYGLEATRQLAIGATALTMFQDVLPNAPAMKEYVKEFLRFLIAHEVGHTLGLRHNFRGSAMLAPGELNNLAITRTKGLVSSVMDYSAVNLAPSGTPQGDYFTHTVGPYDVWAIAYGYTPGTQAPGQSDAAMLEAIARRAPEPDLAYATDEDTDAELDPQVHPFDMSGDSLTYAPWQLDNALSLWQKLDRRSPIAGESFNDVRVAFDDIFDYYFQYAYFLTTYVGGQSFNRYRGGDAVGRLPFEPIATEKQRQALALLQKYVFDASNFRFSPAFLNKLAPSRWNHWGETPEIFTLDYPIHDRILAMQAAMLRNLLSSDRLARLRDADLKTASTEILTIPELFDTLQNAIWREVLHPADDLRLASLSRGLQRVHMNAMIRMVLRQSQVPEDARTVAWYNLRQLNSALENALRRKGKGMDVYTRAHLEETRDRISKALNAPLQGQ